MKHGDGAKDVAFEVEELDIIVQRAKDQGAVFVRDIWSESDDFGTVRFATVKTVRNFPHFVEQFQFFCVADYNRMETTKRSHKYDNEFVF